MGEAQTPQARLIAQLQDYLAQFPRESQAFWTYENRSTVSHALLRDALDALLPQPADSLTVNARTPQWKEKAGNI